MGIWGDLVKRTKPVPAPKPEGKPAVVPGTPLPEALMAAAPKSTTPATFVPVESVPPPLSADPIPTPASTVVVSSALSRPLVLPTIPEGPTHTSGAKTKEKSAPKPRTPRKLPPEEPRSEVLPVSKEKMDENLGLLLERLREPAPPTPAERPVGLVYTPEQVVDFLTSLPNHLSQESRFRRMEEQLRSVATDDTTLAAEIVGEAAAKLVDLRRNLSTRQTVFDSQVKAEKKQIAQLESEIARLRAELDVKEKEFQAQRQEALTQVDEMTGVIVFFDSYQAFRSQGSVEEAEAEEFVPAYLRDDTAERLLGLKDRQKSV